MDTLLQAYGASVLAFGAMAALMLIQVLVADVFAILRKHVPGTPVQPDHGDALFRASRTVANTNESIAIFVCALLFCILSSASPMYTAFAAWTFVVSRALYAICYYTNQQALRSTCFGVSILALLGMVVVGAIL